MENKSLWTKKIKKNYCDSLDKDITCDVLIIGGGISGLTTAYYLKQSKKKIILVDKDACGFGISSLTTAKFTFMQGLIYNKLTKLYNSNTATSYLQSQKDAIRMVKNIVTRNNIDCNLENTASYLFTNNLKEVSKMKKEEQFYIDNNVKIKSSNKIPLTNYPCLYSLKVNAGLVIQPLKYLLSLKKILLKTNVSIYEKTLVKEVVKKSDYYEVITNTNNKILAKKVIVTCHYPFFLFPGMIPFKTNIQKSYILSGIFPKNKKFQAITSSNPVESIRFYSNTKNNYILYGGESHNTSNHLDSEKRYEELINKYKKNINKNIKYYWVNHDIMTVDSMPLIGKIDDNLYIATGFNKWGMTNGTLAGKILSDLVLNKDNKYIELFNPKRKINFKDIINLVVYNFSNSKIYLLTKIKKKHSFYKENIKIEVRDNEKVGIYIDKYNKEHVVLITCPHLKCSLVFNCKDKTWDCPCHGSRFDIDGNLLFGPSKKSICINKKDL